MDTPNNRGVTGPRVAAVSILSVFAVYLVVLLIGGPITALGNKETSFLYAVLVFIPVALICIYTITRRES
jgi:hypothetical protein